MTAGIVADQPSGWRSIQLKHIVSCNDDQLDDRQGLDTQIRYVDISSVVYGKGIIAHEEFVLADAPSRARRMAREGDVLVSTVRTYLKAIAPVGREYADCVFSTGFAILRARNQHLMPAYLKWLMLEENLIQRIEAHSEGLSYPAINASLLIDLKVAIPCLETQADIATFLDRETQRIDVLLSKKRRFIDLLVEKEKADVSQLVRLGLDNDAVRSNSHLDWRGQVPSHWNRTRLGLCFRVEKRQGFIDLTVLSVYRDFGVIEKSSRNDNSNKTPEDLSTYQLVNVGDLVINKMKAWQGSLGVSQHRGFTSPDYVVLRPCSDHIPRYMHHYLRAQPMPWVYRLISNGIRENQWRMEPDKFLALPIYLPPLAEQEAIADEIDKRTTRISDLVAATERSIGLLKEHRSALITAAVTGKIDVRAAVAKNMKAAA